MARVTSEEVQAIIHVRSSISDLSPFIDAANELVTELCVPEGYTATRLKTIELWLAAHFVAIRDPRMSSEGAGGASGSYQGQTSMMLSHTSYGQQALLLDTGGALARLNAHVTQGKRATPGVSWLGTEIEVTEE